MPKITHNPTGEISCSYFTTILKLYLAKISKTKVKVKVKGTPDDRKGQNKEPYQKLQKKDKGISSKYLTKLIIGNYWMRPIMK